MLNPEQMAAAHFKKQHQKLLILAGAGCGKTKVITERISYLINNNQDPSKMVAITFTQRSAADLKRQLKKVLGKQGSSLFIGTFHSFCLGLIKNLPSIFGSEGHLIIDETDQADLFEIAISNTLQTQTSIKKQDLPKTSVLLTALSFARNKMTDIRKHMKTSFPENSDIIIAIIDTYKQEKKSRNYLDFDDLQEKIIEASTIPGFTQQLRRHIEFIAVDEMQDTNPAQLQLLKILSGGKSELFCVGDDAQCIYSFRAAEVSNIQSFSHHFPGSTTLKLSTNYRSSSEILSASNWLMSKSSLFYNPLRSNSGATGVKPTFTEFFDPESEAEWIANKISDQVSHGVDFKDNLILLRTSHISRDIESALIRCKIPYEFIGGSRLSSAAHIKIVLSSIRAAFNQNDELAWVRYLTLFSGIGIIKSHSIYSKIRELGDSITDKDLESIIGSNHPAYELIHSIRSQETPKDAVSQAITILSPKMSEALKNWSSRKRDLNLLRKLSGRYKTMDRFLTDLTLEPITSSSLRNQDTNSVKIMTIHAAKGSEAKVCFIPHADRGIYPHKRSIGSTQTEEEERRVLYVAMTRAMNQLHITSTPTFALNIDNESQVKTTSYFFESKPEDIFSKESPTASESKFDTISLK